MTSCWDSLLWEILADETRWLLNGKSGLHAHSHAYGSSMFIDSRYLAVCWLHLSGFGKENLPFCIDLHTNCKPSASRPPILVEPTVNRGYECPLSRVSIYGRSPPKVSQVARYISNLWETNVSAFFLSLPTCLAKEHMRRCIMSSFSCLEATCRLLQTTVPESGLIPRVLETPGRHRAQRKKALAAHLKHTLVVYAPTLCENPTNETPGNWQSSSLTCRCTS